MKLEEEIRKLEDKINNLKKQNEKLREDNKNKSIIIEDLQKELKHYYILTGNGYI